jgi:hypothetical protein
LLVQPPSATQVAIVATSVLEGSPAIRKIQDFQQLKANMFWELTKNNKIPDILVLIVVFWIEKLCKPGLANWCPTGHMQPVMSFYAARGKVLKCIYVHLGTC